MQIHQAQIIEGCEVCEGSQESLKVFVIEVSPSSYKVLIEGNHLSQQKTLLVKRFCDKQLAICYYKHLVVNLSTAFMA